MDFKMRRVIEVINVEANEVKATSWNYSDSLDRLSVVDEKDWDDAFFVTVNAAKDLDSKITGLIQGLGWNPYDERCAERYGVVKEIHSLYRGSLGEVNVSNCLLLDMSGWYSSGICKSDTRKHLSKTKEAISRVSSITQRVINHNCVFLEGEELPASNIVLRNLEVIERCREILPLLDSYLQQSKAGTLQRIVGYLHLIVADLSDLNLCLTEGETCCIENRVVELKAIKSSCIEHIRSLQNPLELRLNAMLTSSEHALLTSEPEAEKEWLEDLKEYLIVLCCTLHKIV